jgi:hypothetical protein
MQNATRILIGKPERKRPPRNPRGMNLREIGWDGVDCIDLAYDTVLSTAVMNLWVT